jgi:hypothetical protein
MAVSSPLRSRVAPSRRPCWVNRKSVGVPVRGCGSGPVRGALRGPRVQRSEGGPVEWHAAFGGEFAERDAQPDPGRAVVDDAADFEV